MPAWRRRIAIGCAMKGLLAGVVKTSAAKRALGPVDNYRNQTMAHAMLIMARKLRAVFS